MTAASPARTGVSPSSSPRLPSPPPFTEVQFGPTSPSIGASVTELQLEAAGQQDDGASRRIRPGTKALDMARGPPFVALHQLESAFQLQEYLKTLYHKLTRDETSDTVQPVTKEMAMELATPPTAADTGETVDRNLWLYELCRFLCSRTTRIIVAFFADNPPCSSQTCPEMRASEWQYLCAVHEPPKSCCAIDYCNHTLDWASNVLTSTKHFPSRLSLGGEGGNAFQSMRQLTNIFRRVYRIYAHAWFQHREVFWAIEAELGLYMFFKTVCDVYQLIPEDNYTIPAEAEGSPEDNADVPVSIASPQQMQIMQKESEQTNQATTESTPSTTISTGATTRRHKHTPSTGVPVAVIAEGMEEEEDTSQSSHDAQESTGPLSPQRSTFSERMKSPGRIAIPKNTEPILAPEDPTPVAHHEQNPLASAMTQHQPEEKTIAMPATRDESIMTSDTNKATSSQANDGFFQVGDPDVLDAILGHMDETKEPTQPDSDAEAETVMADDTNEEKTAVKIEDAADETEGDETMERIDLPSASTRPAPKSESPEIKHEHTELEKEKGAAKKAAGGDDDVVKTKISEDKASVTTSTV